MSVITKDSSRRLGLVKVHDDLLRESINNGIAARLFYGSVPIDIQRHWMHRTTTFTLWHPKFDEIEQHSQIPEYVALIENGAINWERQESRDTTAAITAEFVQALKQKGGAQ